MKLFLLLPPVAPEPVDTTHQLPQSQVVMIDVPKPVEFIRELE